jgi:uncharacterized protein YcaQ
MSQVIPLIAARTLALQVQELTTPNGEEQAPTIDAIYEIVKRLGCVQIDTLHMVRRAQYLTLWSRLGKYDPNDFDRLIFDPIQRRLFEHWRHAASIIPLCLYRYQMPYMIPDLEHGWWSRWLAENSNREMLEMVRTTIQQEGARRGQDFKYDGPRRGSWWDWKPAKFALEYLFATGEIMIANRTNFQRVYDLRERVLPEWVDVQATTLAEAQRFFVEQAVKALGICRPEQAAEYAYLKRGTARPHVEASRKEGILLTVDVVATDGKKAESVIHRDNLPVLQRVLDGDLRAERTTFINPFDSLLWARGRDQQLWGFRAGLEAYKPAAQRIWGYYCLSILHRDRLVGRFDPKLERKTGLLRLKALYLEPGIEPDEQLVTDVAAAMRNFMAFHNAKELIIEKSQPEMFGAKLLLAITATNDDS